jgi:hypothetical protein
MMTFGDFLPIIVFPLTSKIKIESHCLSRCNLGFYPFVLAMVDIELGVKGFSFPNPREIMVQL